MTDSVRILPASRAPGALPLAGVRVLDLTDEALVLAPRLLSDLGADVVRIEDRTGDRIRRRPPFVHREPGLERSLAHILYNAGKRSLALDLSRPEAWELVRELTPGAPVAIGPLEKSALASAFLDSLLPGGPAVVDAVFRRDAPSALATDLVGCAASGLLCLNGYEEDPPNHPAGQLAYKQASLAVAVAAMSAILQRRRTGGGGRITVSLQEALSWTTIQSGNENFWHWHQLVPRRRGLANLGGQTVFEAKDGRWVSFYLHPPYWKNFTRWVREALGIDTLDAPEWDDRMYRTEHHAEIAAIITELARTLPRDEFVAEGQRRSLLVVPVQTAADIADDPHLRARGFFQQVDYPQLGAALEVARPPFLANAYRAVARRAPALGEHSREVLADAGFAAGRIDALITSGILAEPAAVPA